MTPSGPDRAASSGDGDDVVIVVGDQRVTRETYKDRVARAVTVLTGLGVEAGGCVGVALRNRPQFFELLAAARALDAKAFPVAWRLKQEEVRYLVEDSGAKVVIYDNDSAAQMTGLPGLALEAYEDLIAGAAPAPGLEGAERQFTFDMYSSGTTGRPKAIERALAAPLPTDVRGRRFLEPLGVGGPGEVHMMCGPLYHSQPVGFSTFALALGQRVVMMEGSFDAEACLRTIERERVSWITCVPTHFVRILALPKKVRDGYNLSSLKVVLHSAAPCPPDVKRAMIDLFPLNSVWEIYGGTEGAMTMIGSQEWLKKPGSVGRGFPLGSRLRILDAEGQELPCGQVGLIYGQAATRFRYRGAPELDAQTWRGDLYTLGDMGYVDEDGYLFMTDRMKDMIISGGANIYPAEVEAVLFNHPAVADTAVIGVPDAEWGERVKAIVETRGETSASEIMTFCRDHLAHYKCPTSVDFVERLPRDPSGKLRKRELREAYWANAGRAV